MMLPIEGQPILTAAQMKAAEARAAPTAEAMYALMERAGAGVAEAVHRLATGAEVLILCGPGNNGGDGYVAARVLREKGHPVRVAAGTEPTRDLARRARAGWPGPVEPLAEAAPAAVLVDAIFGTGLSRPLDHGLIDRLHQLNDRARLSIAVDLPSGLAADDGACLSDVPVFDVTLALGAIKPSHLLQPAAERCGAVRLLDLGPRLESEVTVLGPPMISAPMPDAHKFSRGMIAIVAGVMPGAAALAATAAARGGAGYVLLLGSATDRLPHAIVRRRWSAGALADNRINAMLIGPGLGRDESAREKLAATLAVDAPLVIDGDALHLVDIEALGDRPQPTILTPHEGEFSALFGQGEGSRIDRARAAARRSSAVVVLKGAGTVIARPDGMAWLSTPATSWLASAGTGDMLAGMIATMLATGHGAFGAAGAGVWLHGEAARRAGPSFVADDLASHLPAAIAACL